MSRAGGYTRQALVLSRMNWPSFASWISLDQDTRYLGLLLLTSATIPMWLGGRLTVILVPVDISNITVVLASIVGVCSK